MEKLMSSIMEWAYWPLRVILAITFIGVTVLQTLSFPGGFRHQAKLHPEDVLTPWPAILLVGFALLCVQVVLVSTWVLLGKVRRDRIFDQSSFRWVDAIVIAFFLIGFEILGLLVVAFATGNVDDPGAPFLLIMVGLGFAVATLLMLVMRQLLKQATDLRTDMDAVI